MKRESLDSLSLGVGIGLLVLSVLALLTAIV